jgi:hypothetical protein
MASPHDEDGLSLAVGSGVVLFQVFAIIPGLLPCLLLVLPLVLPVVVLGLAAGLLVGVPLGIWRLGASAWRRLRAHRRCHSWDRRLVLWSRVGNPRSGT